MTDWQVGMKAVCIKRKLSANALIKSNSVYVVSAVRMLDKGTLVKWETTSGPTMRTVAEDFLVLMLAEFSGVWYPAECFRPLVERKTDIALFTAMLNTVKEPERELAR